LIDDEGPAPGVRVLGRAVVTPTGACPASGVVNAFLGWLAQVDVGGMGEHERVAFVSEVERVKGAASAAQARAVDALRQARERTTPQGASRSVGSEVALARRESPTLGDRFVGVSRALMHEMPFAMAALTAGEIGERHAVEVVAASAALSAEGRSEVDRRVAPVLGRVGVRGLGSAARRVAAEVDVASVVRRMEAAVAARRVSVRPAPDGMAYLTILGPLVEVIGAYAALRRRAGTVVGGQCPREAPLGRGVGAVMADTALSAMSGRAPGRPQPVEVHLVMTDRALLGTGDPARSLFEPARVPGHGSLPAPVARAVLRRDDDDDDGDGAVWLRRLYTGPTGRDLVGMDSRRRSFSGALRRMLVLRDDVCTTPWCGAPIVHGDHALAHANGGPTGFGNGRGACARCNYVKEAPGWRIEVTGGEGRLRPGRLRAVAVRTPSGHLYRSRPPPLLGWGWRPPGPADTQPAEPGVHRGMLVGHG
jgi:hypothetical protein